MSGVFEMYRDAGEKWRWRLKARNGVVVLTSSQSWATQREVRRAIRSTQRAAKRAAVKMWP